MGLSVSDKKQVDTKNIVRRIFGDAGIGGQIFGDTESIQGNSERVNTSAIVQFVFDELGQFAPVAESLGITGIPQAQENPLLEQFQEGAPGGTAPVAAVGGFVASAIPFLDEIPGFKEGFNEAREAFPKSFGAGGIAGTFLPGAAALKGAKVLLKPLIKRALPLIKSSKKSIEILKLASVAVSEGVVADLLFSALSVEKPSAKSMAVFAAIDFVLPGLGEAVKAIGKKFKTGRQIKQEIKTVLPEKPISTPTVETVKQVPPVKPVAAPITKPVTLSEALENKPFQVTSARKAEIAKKREEIGLKALNTPEIITWNQSLRNAKAKGIPEDALRLADEINVTPRSFNDEETAGLVIKLSDLKSKYSKLNLENAKLTDPTDIKLKSAEIERLEEDFNRIHSALKKSGTEKGRTLAAQKLTIDQDFDLIAVKQRARAAGGKKLDENQSKKFKAMVDRMDAKTKQVQELEKQLIEARARGAVVGRRNKFKGMSKVQKDAELSALVSKAKKLINDSCQVIA